MDLILLARALLDELAPARQLTPQRDRLVLGGITAGFLLFVISKITDDLAKAELMYPAAAAWLPVALGGLTGFVALLYSEDG